MKREKENAYFITSDTEELYELSSAKKKKLEEKHPNWNKLVLDKNYEELNEVYLFFKNNGKLLAHQKLSNIFVGLIE